MANHAAPPTTSIAATAPTSSARDRAFGGGTAAGTDGDASCVRVEMAFFRSGELNDCVGASPTSSSDGTERRALERPVVTPVGEACASSSSAISSIVAKREVAVLLSAMRTTASTGAGMSGFFVRGGGTSWLRICATSFSGSASRSHGSSPVSSS